MSVHVANDRPKQKFIGLLENHPLENATSNWAPQVLSIPILI